MRTYHYATIDSCMTRGEGQYHNTRYLTGGYSDPAFRATHANCSNASCTREAVYQLVSRLATAEATSNSCMLRHWARDKRTTTDHPTGAHCDNARIIRDRQTFVSIIYIANEYSSEPRISWDADSTKCHTFNFNFQPKVF